MDAVRDRNAGIVRTSLEGIGVNLGLVVAKMVVGLLAHSIAIVLDALNNLSDVLSSVVTIIGARIASKPADREHPYGHGRAEYLATMVVGAIVLAAGVSALWEALTKFRVPDTPDYHASTVVVTVLALFSKVALGLYFRRRGREYASDTLIASGTDALLDALISLVTLAAIILFFVAHISVEPWLAGIISLLIIRAGYDILRDGIGNILGRRVDAEITRAIKDDICQVEGVEGAYDLVLNDYGPQRLMGSVHIEVDERLSARQVDAITRTVQQRVLENEGVALHTVGIYSTNHGGTNTAGKVHLALDRMCAEIPEVLEVHGLYVDEKTKRANFDMVVSFETDDRQALVREVLRRISDEFPELRFAVTVDNDVSD